MISQLKELEGFATSKLFSLQLSFTENQCDFYKFSTLFACNQTCQWKGVRTISVKHYPRNYLIAIRLKDIEGNIIGKIEGKEYEQVEGDWENY